MDVWDLFLFVFFCFSKVIVLAEDKHLCLMKDEKFISYKMRQIFFEIINFTA